MYNFDLTNHADVVRKAEELGITHAESAALLKSPLIKNPDLWFEPVQAEVDESANKINLVSAAGGKGFLCKLINAINETYQFPKSTAYLHALGCIANACCRSFEFEYFGGYKPLNLYTVSSQPPSTGKSGVNEVLSVPIAIAYEALNKRNKAKIAELSAEIEELEGQKHEQGTEGYERLIKLIEELENTYVYKYTLTDATIESAEGVAGKQGGMFNVVSAEADSINTILGLTYSQNGVNAKANHGLVLQGWDGEMYSSSRVTRAGYTGFIRGSIAVIAQDSSLDSILSTSELERGTPERFLMVREPDLLGTRVFFDYKPMDRALVATYDKLIYNIVNEEKTQLRMDKKAYKLLMSVKQAIEPDLSARGKYSHQLLRGFMGKADKHILKIAYTLFVVDNWVDGGARSLVMTGSYIETAIRLFDELSKTYIKAADNLGYVGKQSNVEKMKQILTMMAEKGRLKTTFESIRSNYRKVKPFRGIPKFSEALKNDIVPVCQKDNYCVVDGNDIYINPRLK